jgi:imidazolonepropionase-like amidohydrolase
MKERAAQFGMTPEMLAKNDLVLEHGYRSLEVCKRAGVPVAYGSDLLGQLQEEQSREFLIRAEVMKPLEVIQAATTVAARVLRREGKLGVIAPGAFADLLLVDGNPLGDLGLLQNQGAHLAAVMKGGRFHEHRLA